MLQLGDSFYAGVFRSGSSVAHRLLTSHSKQGISNPGMEAKAEETLKPSEAGLREGTPTDIPIASGWQTRLQYSSFLGKSVLALGLTIRNLATESDQDRGSLSSQFTKLKVIAVGNPCSRRHFVPTFTFSDLRLLHRSATSSVIV